MTKCSLSQDCKVGWFTMYWPTNEENMIILLGTQKAYEKHDIPFHKTMSKVGLSEELHSPLR